MKYKIIPTLMAKNQKELNILINKYKDYFKYFQVDVMDGNFVRNKSNWFKFKLPKNFTYEAHLMINDPEKWIKKNYKQFDILIANFERVKNPMKLIEFVKSKKKKLGFVLNPETSINLVIPYLKYLDRVLILTVHPGKYGAEFLPETLHKVKVLRKIYKGNIEVDGHINPEVIRLCKILGANLFAIGSYLKNSKDISKSKKELSKFL
ncbi:hypothetical protein HYU23_02085 [Candidatus Woesearchaeota archaeon]|nr:hypothetical protein [Candidatus Woesearchaeota archaeon]